MCVRTSDTFSSQIRALKGKKKKKDAEVTIFVCCPAKANGYLIHGSRQADPEMSSSRNFVFLPTKCARGPSQTCQYVFQLSRLAVQDGGGLGPSRVAVIVFPHHGPVHSSLAWHLLGHTRGLLPFPLPSFPVLLGKERSLQRANTRDTLLLRHVLQQV